MITIFIDTIKDTYLMLPLLYVTYLVIEHFERKDSDDDFVFLTLQKYGPFFGALIGIIPQCGFSIIASMLFLNNNITIGTLLSVFIATSDEAIPILISNPKLYKSMIFIIIIKIIAGMIIGFIVDKLIYRKQNLLLFSDMEEEDEDEEYEEDASEGGNACPCCYVQYPIYISAFLRALKIFAFIFITSIILNILMSFIGEDGLKTILLTNSIFQPVVAAVIGFIPNCIASVVLTQLYVSGALTFTSLIAGLITNAGLGLVVLVRYSEDKKTIARFVGLLFISALLTAFVIHFIF